MFLFAGAVVLAAMLLGVSNRGAPTASADPSTVSFDITMADPAPPGNAVCTAGTAGNGLIQPGECVNVLTNLKMDLNGPGSKTSPSLDEAYFDLATTIWEVTGSTSSAGADQDGDTVADGSGFRNIPTSGLRATPGALIREGAKTGGITFSIQSNGIALGNNNIMTDGQPPAVDISLISPPFLSDTFDIFEATTVLTPTVAVIDTDGDGYAQSQEDNVGAGCTGSPDGLLDGVNCMPDAIPQLLSTLNYPAGSMEGRSFGLANIATVVTTDVYVDANFLIVNLVPEGLGYVSFTVVQYNFVPASNPWPLTPSKALGQGVDTAPPFVSVVNTFGVTTDNKAKHPRLVEQGGTVTPNVNGGEILRQIVSGSSGTYPYRIFHSTDEDYDNDGRANAYDLCKIDPANGIDQDSWVGGPGPTDNDVDNDALTGTCDINGPASNPYGALGHSNCPDTEGGIDGFCDTGFGGWQNVWSTGQDNDRADPPGDWNGDGCPGICLVDDDGDTTVDEGAATDDDENAATSDGGTAVIGDGFLNGDDTCPALPSVDIDSDTVIEYQMDTDGDTVGDPCDKAPAIPGDGRGYWLTDGTLFDWDRICNDDFTIGSAEGAGGGVCATGADSNDNSTPDLWDFDLSGSLQSDEYDTGNSDNPAYNGNTTTTTDYESDACEVWRGTDPLDPTSNSGTGSATKWDCDGDTIADKDDTTPFGNAPVPSGDFDRDGCTAAKELGTNAALGGKRNPTSPWDFYDVPAPTIGGGGSLSNRDRAVSIGNDVLAVLEYSGTSLNGPPNAGPDGIGGNADDRDYDQDVDNNGVKDGIAYDRSTGVPLTDAPNGSISIGEDVLLVLDQSGSSCQ
jgi:hypothetical protein